MPPEPPRRFVVQQHDLSAGPHWDLMLEHGEVLATWQLTAPPEVAAALPTAARRLAEHRKIYLDYEGPVSHDRGHVHIVDTGTYVLLAAGESEWRVELAGRILQGTFQLTRNADGGADEWTLQRRW